jgi:hypothetical protein
VASALVIPAFIDERIEFMFSQTRIRAQQHIEPVQDGLYRTGGTLQVRRQQRRGIGSCGIGRGQVIADRVLQMDESAVVHECGLQRDIAQRRCPERVPVRRVPRRLFQPEILVQARTVEYHVAERRIDLRYAGDVLSEVTEHLVRFARHGVALDAAGPAEEQNGALFLRGCQRAVLAARVAVDRRVREDERELELRDRAGEVVERDRTARLHVRQHAREQLAILGRLVQASCDLGADVIIVRPGSGSRPPQPSRSEG